MAVVVAVDRTFESLDAVVVVVVVAVAVAAAAAADVTILATVTANMRFQGGHWWL